MTAPARPRRSVADQRRAAASREGGRPCARGDGSGYHDVFSVTKSVISALVGAALADGSLRGLDQTLPELLPAYAPTMGPDAAATTLEQLLTMTAGYPDDAEAPAHGPDADWVAGALARLDRPSGGPFAYANDAAHLVAAALREATGMPVLAYARRVLLDPLGIPSEPALEPLAEPSSFPAYEAAGFSWPVDPQGVHTGAAWLKLRTRDLAAIGQLHLDGSRHDGVQVLPAAWVAAATGAHVTAGGAARAYGNFWWVDPDEGSYAAIGHGGQRVEVVPARAAVVAVSTRRRLDAEDRPPVEHRETAGLVDAVLAALPGGPCGDE